MKKLASKGLLMSALICGNVLLGGNAVFAEEVHEYDLERTFCPQNAFLPRQMKVR